MHDLPARQFIGGWAYFAPHADVLAGAPELLQPLLERPPADIAFDRDEARTEPVHAREIFVACVLINLSFSSEVRFLGHYRQTIGFDRLKKGFSAFEVFSDEEPLFDCSVYV